MGSRCRFSRTPGRKGSIRISVSGRRERRREREVGDLRSRQMEDLWVVRRSPVGGGSGGGDDDVVEAGDGELGLDCLTDGGG